MRCYRRHICFQRWFHRVGEIISRPRRTLFIKYDREDGGLYIAGTMTHGGSSQGANDHPHCPDDLCPIVMHLDSSDGTIDWIRTVKESARWGAFDQSGGLELADEEKYGPYMYVALEDTGEGEVEMEASL